MPRTNMKGYLVSSVVSCSISNDAQIWLHLPLTPLLIFLLRKFLTGYIYLLYVSVWAHACRGAPVKVT